jgi:hypothetical protein
MIAFRSSSKNKDEHVLESQKAARTATELKIVISELQSSVQVWCATSGSRVLCYYELVVLHFRNTRSG